MATEADFLAALRDDPSDDVTRLVFADWLAERDDPREAWMRDPRLARWSLPGFVDPLPIMAAAILDDDAHLGLIEAGEAAVPALLKQIGEFGDLGDSPEVARMEEVLGRLVEADPRLAEASRRLEGEILSGVRAVTALGAEAGPLVPALIAAGSAHPMPEVRRAIIDALGRMGPLAPLALHAAWWRARWEPDEDASWAVLVALESTAPHPVAFELIRRILNRPDSPELSEAAHRTLRALTADGLAGWFSSLTEDHARADHWGMALIQFGPEGAAAVVADLRRQLAAEGVAFPTGEVDLVAGLRFGMHADATVSGHCVTTLHELGHRFAVEDLAPLLRTVFDRSGWGLAAAQRALESLGEVVVEPVSVHLESAAEDDIWAACTILGWIGPAARAAIPALLRCLPTPQGSSHAIWAIVRILAAGEAYELLRPLALASDDLEMRRAAARTLSSLSPNLARE